MKKGYAKEELNNIGKLMCRIADFFEKHMKNILLFVLFCAVVDIFITKDPLSFRTILYVFRHDILGYGLTFFFIPIGLQLLIPVIGVKKEPKPQKVYGLFDYDQPYTGSSKKTDSSVKQLRKRIKRKTTKAIMRNFRKEKLMLLLQHMDLDSLITSDNGGNATK